MGKQKQNDVEGDLNTLVMELMKEKPSYFVIEECAQKLKIPFQKDSISMMAEVLRRWGPISKTILARKTRSNEELL